MRVFKTTDSTSNMCDFCKLQFPTCPVASHLKFDNGVKNSNVIECSEYNGSAVPNNDPVEIDHSFGMILAAKTTRDGRKLGGH